MEKKLLLHKGMNIVFVIALIVLASMLIERNGINDRLATQKMEAEMKLRDQQQAHALTKQKVAALEGKLASLKTHEDIMKRDLFLYIKGKFPHIPNVLAKEISEQAVTLSVKHGAPFPIVVGIMEVESHFNPMAVSKAGARGLMQVMPFWVDKIDCAQTKYDFHNVDIGIESGIIAFKEHLKEADNNIAKGLYYYVGKDKTYKDKVFSAMGEFVAFRSTVDQEDLTSLEAPEEG